MDVLLETDALDILKEWREEDHPRQPAGTSEGGQFRDLQSTVMVAGKNPERAISNNEKVRRIAEMADQIALRERFQGQIIIESDPDAGVKRDDEGRIIGRVAGKSNTKAHLIRLYAETLGQENDDMIRSVIAHEIQHQKFQRTYDDPDLAEYRSPEVVQRLMKSGNLTYYASTFWSRAKRAIKINHERKDFWLKLAINETLAEIAGTRAEGRRLDFPGKQSALWRNYYDDMQTVYKRYNPDLFDKPEGMRGVTKPFGRASKVWVEEDHPRHPAGTEQGGEFAPKDGSVDVPRHLDDAESPEQVKAWLEDKGYTPATTPKGDTIWLSPDKTEVVIWDGKSEFTDREDVNTWIYDQDVDEHFPDYDDQYNKEFWDSTPTLYHGTPSADLIMGSDKGLQARYGARGIDNRNVGAAVFTSTNEFVPADYAEGATSEFPVKAGAILKIDTKAMKRDGYTPFVTEEPPLKQYELRRALANKIGLDDWEADDPSGGYDTETVIVHGDIPRKYLSVLRSSRVKKAKTVQAPEDGVLCVMRRDRGMITRAIAASVRKWDESKHPRHPAGTEEGGEFAPKEGGGFVPTNAAFKEWFGDSQVVDDKGNPLVMYHGSTADFTGFRPFSHFGTAAAANDLVSRNTEFFDQVLNRPDRSEGANIIPVYLSVQNPLEMPDLASVDDQYRPLYNEDGKPIDTEGDEIPDDEVAIDENGDERHPVGWEGEEAVATYLLNEGIIDIDEFESHRSNDAAFRLLQSKGYDGIKYNNVVEDPGSTSWIVFKPSQVKSAYNRGTWSRRSKDITKEWDESEHPRHPAGTEQGGEFAPKGGDTNSSEFRDWFGNSKVVDENGKPLKVFHGTWADFSEFDPDKSGDIGLHFGTIDQANRALFPTAPDTYSEGANVMPVYLRIENPIRVQDKFSTMGQRWIARAKDFWLGTSGFRMSDDERDEMYAAAKEADSLRRKTRGDAAMYFENNKEVRAKYDAAGRRFWRTIMRSAERQGYDGMVYSNRIEGKGDSWVAFHPSQVKSVFNRGTWSRTSPDITKWDEAQHPRQPGGIDEHGGEFVSSQVSEAARQAGFVNRVYHGTTAQFDEFDPEKQNDYMLDRALGVHVAKDPRVSESFTIERTMGAEPKLKEGGRMLPLLTLDDSKFLTIEQKPYDYRAEESKTREFKPWEAIETDQYAIQHAIMEVAFRKDPAMLERYFIEARNLPPREAKEYTNRLVAGERVQIQHVGKPQNLMEFVRDYGGKPYNERDRTRAVNLAREEWQSKGYVGIKYLNTAPMETIGIRDATSYIVFDPKHLRSVHAAFNPLHIGHAGLMKEWDESKHPRHPAGTEEGGEFAPKWGGPYWVGRPGARTSVEGASDPSARDFGRMLKESQYGVLRGVWVQQNDQDHFIWADAAGTTHQEIIDDLPRSMRRGAAIVGRLAVAADEKTLRTRWTPDPADQLIRIGRFTLDVQSLNNIRDTDWAKQLAGVRKVEWDESEHPRHPAGTGEGGEFAPKGGVPDEATGHPMSGRQVRLLRNPSITSLSQMMRSSFDWGDGMKMMRVLPLRRGNEVDVWVGDANHIIHGDMEFSIKHETGAYGDPERSDYASHGVQLIWHKGKLSLDEEGNRSDALKTIEGTQWYKRVKSAMERSAKVRKAWDESKHPRHPAGTREGGRFTEVDEGPGVGNLKRYFAMIAQVTGGKGPDGFIAKHGRAYQLDDQSYNGGRPNECYRNAAQAILRNPKLTYVEGYITVHGVPIHHAWTVDKDGKVRDFTLHPKTDDVFGWYGVPVKRSYVFRTMERTGYYGVFTHTNARNLMTDNSDDIVQR